MLLILLILYEIGFLSLLKRKSSIIINKTPKTKLPHLKVFESNKSIKNLILFWGKPWYNERFWLNEGDKIGDCIITFDKKHLLEAKSIIFHFSVIHPNNLPWKHPR